LILNAQLTNDIFPFGRGLSSKTAAVEKLLGSRAGIYRARVQASFLKEIDNPKCCCLAISIKLKCNAPS
jgi:hypothetical protein